MTRLTIKDPDGSCRLPADSITIDAHGITGSAVDRLSRFENLYEFVTAEQDRITQKMDDLRADGKDKTVQFRELFGNKMLLASLQTYFQTFGITP